MKQFFVFMIDVGFVIDHIQKEEKNPYNKLGMWDILKTDWKMYILGASDQYIFLKLQFLIIDNLSFNFFLKR